MERFLTRHRDRITGSITGFDRILFRGSLRSICYGEGMDIFLSSQRVLYKDFRTFVQKLSAGIKARAEQLAQQAGRPFLYLSSAQESKEEIARRIQRSSRRADLRAVLRRALPDIRDSPGPGEEGIDVGSAGAQVFAFLLLLPRPGIWVDAHPCVQLSRAANERYWEALAVVGELKASHRILDPVSRAVETPRRFRAQRPISPEDSRLFQDHFARRISPARGSQPGSATTSRTRRPLGFAPAPPTLGPDHPPVGSQL